MKENLYYTRNRMIVARDAVGLERTSLETEMEVLRLEGTDTVAYKQKRDKLLELEGMSKLADYLLLGEDGVLVDMNKVKVVDDIVNASITKARDADRIVNAFPNLLSGE